MIKARTRSTAKTSSAENKLTASLVSDETIRTTLKRMGVNWKRARDWMSSPDPGYVRKKKARDRLIRLAASHPKWVLGYEDEVWWSRLAQPTLQTWTPDEPLRLEELTAQKADPDPKALACYGLLRADTGRLWLRFVAGRPVSVITIAFLQWLCEQLQAEGKEALLLIWDNASWHVSQMVRNWLRSYNREAKREGKLRILLCQLPTKSPWLNRIEPHWMHGKKAIVEPTRKLSAAELKTRVCDYYGCDLFSHLSK